MCFYFALGSDKKQGVNDPIGNICFMKLTIQAKMGNVFLQPLLPLFLNFITYSVLLIAQKKTYPIPTLDPCILPGPFQSLWHKRENYLIPKKL